jgi:DNA-binding NarL/FixJ family response regulator
MKILLVDDHVLFREGLAGLINSQPDLTVVGSADSVEDAIAKACALKPDLILMDFGLPDGTGLDATRAILEDSPHIKIVFLTMHEDDERLFEALRSGAKGYLFKNTSVNKLLSFIRGVEQGEAAITRSTASRLLDIFARTTPLPSSPPAELEILTPRELEILQELDTGATNREIANRLVISERTVKNHVSNILSKLNLKNRYEASRFARRHGLIDF